MKRRYTSSFIIILLFLFSVGVKAQDIVWHRADTIGGNAAKSLEVSCDNQLYSSFYTGSAPVLAIARYNGIPYNWSTVLSLNSLADLKVSDSILLLEGSDGSTGTMLYITGHGNIQVRGEFRSMSLAKDNTIIYCTDQPGRLYRTTDLGSTWDTLISETPTNFISLNYSFCASKDIMFVSGVIDMQSGILHTVNGGKTWNWMPFVPSKKSYVAQISYQNGLIYALLSSGGIYRGKDTLYACKTPIPIWFLQRIIVDKNDNIYGMRADTLLYRSTDHGNSWDSISAPNFDDFCADSSGHLYASTGSSVLTSENNGKTWNEIGTSRRIKPRIILAGRKPFLFSYTYQGILRSEDNGHTWTLLPFPALKEVQAFHVTKDGNIIAAVKDTNRIVSIVISHDNAETWETLPAPPNQPIYNIFYIITSNNNGDIFALDYSEDLYILEKGTREWIKSTIVGVGSNTFSLAAGDSGVVYTGAAFGKVYRSENNGRSFKPIPEIDARATINHIALGRSETVYLGADSIGILRSKNKGQIWEEVNTGLPTKNISGLALDPAEGLYAATDLGVYYLSHDDIVWQRENTGLLDSNIFSMTMRGGSELFVSTKQLGIYRTDIPSYSVKSTKHTGGIALTIVKDRAASYQVQFELPRRLTGRIELIDALGRRIRTLWDGIMETEKQTISFSARELASGVYFVRLLTGSEQAVASFVK